MANDEIKIGRQNILIVDDMLPNRKILERIISGMGHTPILASSGKEALTLLEEGAKPSLILLDISMPDMDGFELCRILKADVYCRDIPVVFISAFSGIEDVVKGFELGGVDYICKPFVPAEVSVRVTNHLHIFAMQKEREVYNHRLNKLIDEQAVQLENEKRKVLFALAKLNAKLNTHIVDNAVNEQHNCRILAQSMQLSSRYEQIISNTFIEDIELAAPLHNIGMIAISKAIIDRYYGGTLSEDEFALYKEHTTMGAEIINEMEPDCAHNEFYGMVIDMAKFHHENWDGTGFPMGLKGEEIPLSARIIRIVKSLEGYVAGDKLSLDEAINVMMNYRGTKYDPEIFDIFCKVKNRFRL